MTTPSGFILISKPLHLSSHGVISVLRRITNIKRIGHAGTLDPLATGLLIVAIGREATKRLDQFTKAEKEYQAEIHFGFESISYDAEGPLTKTYIGEPIALDIIVETVSSFRGWIEQYPPKYSAKKIKGRRLYQLARKNEPIELSPSRVEIKAWEIEHYDWPVMSCRISCGSGTYIRSLAHDLGQKLGCGAYLSGLCRTRIGEYSLDQAVELDKIDKENWQQYLF